MRVLNMKLYRVVEDTDHHHVCMTTVDRLILRYCIVIIMPKYLQTFQNMIINHCHVVHELIINWLFRDNQLSSFNLHLCSISKL